MTRPTVGEYRPLAEGVYLEGLCYDFGRDVIWYSDVIKGGIFGVRPDGSPVGGFNEGRMWTGGVAMNACGAVLSSGQGGIMWNNPDTGQSGWLIQDIDGQPINGINEFWPDGSGGMFFGTNDIQNIIEAKETRPTKMYRMTADGDVILLSDTVYFPNGLGYDPARRALYCSDTFRTSWVWDVADDLTLSNQRELFRKTDCDGLAIEADGTILLTGFRSSGKIVRVSPTGEELPPLLTPKGCTTQIRFGGADLCDFYINIVPSDGGDSLKEGTPLTGASYLYRGRSASPGLGVAAMNFRLG